MKEEIKQWLDGPRDYEAGVLLYCRYGKNRNLKSYLQRKCAPLKVLYELSKLVGIDAFAAVPSKQEDLPIIPELKPQERIKVIQDGSIRFDNLPEELKKIYLKACDAYKQMRHLHEKMKLVATDSERASLRAALLEQVDRNRVCWEMIDRWAADGTLPEPTTEAVSTGTVDAKALNSARAGVTRYLNQLDKEPDEEKRANYLAKLRKYVAVITAAGCGFKDNASRLQALGLIE
jgi:hypothetical protein